MNDIAIRVENLSKLYHIGRSRERSDTLRDALAGAFRRRAANGDSADFWALKDVSFEVRRGEVIGVIGRNGAGKSTLLKILSQITEPTSGRAEIHGRVGSLLEVGTGFHPELTGRENIYLNGAILGMRRAEIARKFDEIVAFSEIEKFLDTPVKRYSSGMYVRLAFAVAAHLDPEILLVDEVLAVGDAAFQKKCLGKMSDVASEGRTVLFVSHNMIAMQSLCKQLFWLEEGRLREQGKVDKITTAYLQSGLASNRTYERVWPDAASAPGNETVKLHRIAVRPQNGALGEVITKETPVQIEVDYWNLLPGDHLHVTLHVSNEQGIVAFSASAGFDPDPLLHSRPPAGLFHSVCHIPGNLLNSGFYYVRLLLIRGTKGTNYIRDEILGFEVLDNSERKFAYYGPEPGVISPLLVWETALLNSTDSVSFVETTLP